MLTISYRSLLILFLVLNLSCEFSENHDDKYGIKAVIDGDTVILDDDAKTYLRYIGINAPENLNNNSPGDPFSLESTYLNRELIDGKDIRIEFDKEKYDPYGRLLGYVFVGDTFINEEIVRQGLARVFFIGPNRKYESKLRTAQEEAKKAKIGIWSSPKKFKTPRDNKEFLIKPVSSERYIGQRVVVKGKVSGYRKNSKVLVLKLGEGELDLVFFNDTLENFSFFNIDPVEEYVGKPVEVIGRVKMYRGNPQIVVPHPISIKVLE